MILATKVEIDDEVVDGITTAKEVRVSPYTLDHPVRYLILCIRNTSSSGSTIVKKQTRTSFTGQLPAILDHFELQVGA